MTPWPVSSCCVSESSTHISSSHPGLSCGRLIHPENQLHIAASANCRKFNLRRSFVPQSGDRLRFMRAESAIVPANTALKLKCYVLCGRKKNFQSGVSGLERRSLNLSHLLITNLRLRLRGPLSAPQWRNVQCGQQQKYSTR